MSMEILAFRAFRFNPAVVGDAGDCVSPPYDVISEEQQEQLYAKNRHNIVRIIRARSNDSQGDPDNAYTRAAEYLNEWISSGALKQDAAAAIYAYAQDYELGGRELQRLTFIALGRVEDFGETVKPHERILDKPMQDRLNLAKATDAQFGLVFMLYNDTERVAEGIIAEVVSSEALIDFADEQGVRHRLFAITNPDQIGAITEIIADGHHRYTTGLRYSEESENPAAKYRMLAFTNVHQPGLTVLATHRLIGNLDGFDMKELIRRLDYEFEVRAFEFDGPESKVRAREDMLAAMRSHFDDHRAGFGIYGGGGAFYTAALRSGDTMDSAAPERSAAYRSLDVAVLHKLILVGLLGIDEERKGENLEYVKDTPNAVDDSIAKVDAGRNQVAFFMNPIKLSQLIDVTDAGERMPQKSTYFYPKVYTGLTINKL